VIATDAIIVAVIAAAGLYLRWAVVPVLIAYELGKSMGDRRWRRAQAAAWRGLS